jgi:hypothetical protein
MTRALELSERFELAEWLAARMVRAFGVAAQRSRPSATAPRPAPCDAARWTRSALAWASSRSLLVEGFALGARSPATSPRSSLNSARVPLDGLNGPAAAGSRSFPIRLIPRTLDKERSTTYPVLLEMSRLALLRTLFSSVLAPFCHRLSRAVHLKRLRLDKDASTTGAPQ